MSRYQNTFAQLRRQNRTAFIPFWMLGDPNPDASFDTISNLAQHADILELGIPFSDPLADGPTVQAAAQRALEAGTDTPKALEIVKKLREQYPDKPIGLLVYLNLIMHYGVETFFMWCREAGVDSVLIPELPVEEIALVEEAAAQNEIDLVFIVSTNTPPKRLQKVIAKAQGFIYTVSTPSVTGAKADTAQATLALIPRLKALTDLPVCVGFGVSNAENVRALASAGADGVIMGSALIDRRDDRDAMLELANECRAACCM